MIRRLAALALFAITSAVASADAPKKLLLIAQGPDGHPPATHEYVAGLKVLRACLNNAKGLQLIDVRADEPWKEGPELIGRADAVVLFLCEGAKWMNADPARRDALLALVKRGGGVVGLHWGIGTKDAANIDICLNVLGGCHGGPDRKYKVLDTAFRPADVRHPILTNVGPCMVREEFYYKLKFARQGTVQPLIKAEIEGVEETVAWAWERPDGGRSFGFTGLHFHDNWRHEPYRRLVTQAVLWTLKRPVPETGLPVEVPAELLKLK